MKRKSPLGKKFNEAWKNGQDSNLHATRSEAQYWFSAGTRAWQSIHQEKIERDYKKCRYQGRKMNEVPLRDTTFDKIPAEKLWVTVTNCRDDRKLRVIVEIDGIEKEIFSSALVFDEGNISQSDNLTWLLEKARNSPQGAINALKNIIDDETNARMIAEMALSDIGCTAEGDE